MAFGVGCAGGKLKPETAVKVGAVVEQAQQTLYLLDIYYDSLVAAKVIKAKSEQAVKALRTADMTAAFLKAVIAGASATPEQIAAAESTIKLQVIPALQ